MAEIPVLVTIDDKKANVSDVTAELVAHGLRVTRSMPTTGIVSGLVDDPTTLNRLSRIHGVRGIRPERHFQLPPIREDIPQ